MNKQRIILRINEENQSIQLTTVPKPPHSEFVDLLTTFETQAESLLKELGRERFSQETLRTLELSVQKLVTDLALESGLGLEYAMARTQFEFLRLQDLEQSVHPPPKPHPAIRPAARASAPTIEPMPPEASSATRRKEVEELQPSPKQAGAGGTLRAVLCCKDGDFVAYGSFKNGRESPEVMLYGDRVFLRKGRVVWDLIHDRKATGDRIVAGKEEEFETLRMYLEVTVQVVAR